MLRVKGRPRIRYQGHGAKAHVHTMVFEIEDDRRLLSVVVTIEKPEFIEKTEIHEMMALMTREVVHGVH